ncbi:MAG: sensor histidine kinase, partial [Alphaproteobacteria bacterium]
EGPDWTLTQPPDQAGPGSRHLILAKRVTTENGFAGVAGISLPESPLRSLVSQTLGPAGLIVLANADGSVVSTYAVGQTTAPQEPGSILPPTEGTVNGAYEAYPDRIAAFRRIPQLGLFVVGSVARAAVLEPLWTATRTVLLLMGPIALGLFVAAGVVARLLRRSERTRKELATALEQNKVLFREIHHRVKNNLQSISSLLQLQPIPGEVKVEMGQRIAAMSAVHEHIYRSDDFGSVRIKDYIATLLGNIGAGHDPAVQLVHEIEDLQVDRDAATPLGLILNEVIANAYKHAFRDGPGRILITLVRDGEGMGVLAVEDNGVGFDPEMPSRGIGRRLVRALTEQIGGNSTFLSKAGEKGSRFTLVFPVAS